MSFLIGVFPKCFSPIKTLTLAMRGIAWCVIDTMGAGVEDSNVQSETI